MSRSNAPHLHLCVNCGDDDEREDGRRDHAADHRYGNSLHHLGPGPVLHRIGSSLRVMPYAPLPARSVRKFATIVSSQKLGACATTSFLYHCSARAIERSLECGCTDRMNNYLAVQRRRFRHARNRIFPTSSAICLCCVFGATRTEGGFKGPDALPTTIAFRSSSPCVSSTCTLKPITATQAAIASAV